MTNLTAPDVSVVQPVEPAIERVKQILFRPFKFEKWIAIGFCAWLATLGEGGANFNFNNTSGAGNSNLSHTFDRARDYTLQNLAWIIPMGIALIFVLFVIWIGVVWLSSRGRFMLLHCVALDRGEVAAPWQKFASPAKSLWLFRLMLGAVGLMALLPLLAILLTLMLKSSRQTWHFSTGPLIALVFTCLIFCCTCVALGIVSSFTTNFVLPIMYLRGGTCLEGWRVFRELLSANPGRFVLYLLFQVILGIAVLFLILLAVLCTCCIAGCLLVIPFVGSVALLPVTVFHRAYPLYYLAQYGPEFDVFKP